MTASDPKFDGAKILAPGSRGATMTFEKPEEPQWLQFEYAAPATFRSVRFAGSHEKPAASWDVQSSDDGVHFRKIGAVRAGATAVVRRNRSQILSPLAAECLRES